MWHTNVERRILGDTAMQSRSHYRDDDDDISVKGIDNLYVI